MGCTQVTKVHTGTSIQFTVQTTHGLLPNFLPGNPWVVRRLCIMFLLEIKVQNFATRDLFFCCSNWREKTVLVAPTYFCIPWNHGTGLFSLLAGSRKVLLSLLCSSGRNASRFEQSSDPFPWKILYKPTHLHPNSGKEGDVEKKKKWSQERRQFY